ncbi:hypothetical protein PRIPAC_73646 [Pristionchus pacificus]|uniref:Uncharacterized protein n=1 Tax=Pristionchus pacificus TaxID=54126 RepID=A0A454Y746_PRIPA|nr:hypothetical protein PRIPAC_73646 [Pristionchus pacificus]|eukprot:PDM64423.1 hypothetical protein PRIPAC_52679 [Pristionchus pacificus]
MPLFREGGPFDKLYNRPIKYFIFLKLLLALIFVCNVVLIVQLHHLGADTLEFIQMFYLTCIVFAFFSLRRLDYRYCIPALFFAILNVILPTMIVLYMITAENYCYVREHFWPVEGNKTIVVTKMECVGEFPYASGFYNKLYALLLYGIGKLAEFLLLFHVQKSVERERIALEMMSFMAEKDKKVPPIEDTEDEMVVYKREKNMVV